MTRRTIAILRKLVREEIKEYNEEIRSGVLTREQAFWCKSQIVNLKLCLDEIRAYAETKP